MQICILNVPPAGLDWRQNCLRGATVRVHGAWTGVQRCSTNLPRCFLWVVCSLFHPLLNLDLTGASRDKGKGRPPPGLAPCLSVVRLIIFPPWLGDSGEYSQSSLNLLAGVFSIRSHSINFDPLYSRLVAYM